MIDNDDKRALYRAEFTRKLAATGARKAESCSALPRLTEVCESFKIDEFRFDDHRIFISDGCSYFSDKSSKYRDEFVIHEFINSSVSIEILSYLCFFHITKRSVLPADVLELGSISGLPAKYTHIFVSVPYFFPKSLNEINIDGIIYNLSWALPICRAEASFIQRHGTDEFENRLHAASFGFFELRESLDYLQ